MNEERVAVVTGASSGIGAATARVLAEQGYRVFIGARRMDRLQEVAAAIGPNVIAKPLDVEKLLSLVRVWMPK